MSKKDDPAEDNVIYPYWGRDIDPDRVLDNAPRGEFEQIAVVGRMKNGEYYFASSAVHPPEVAWLLEKFKTVLLLEHDPYDTDQ